MCGLVGVISKNKMGFNRDQQDVFATLLFVDLLRGMDSTGVFVVNTDGDAYVAKDAINSLDFIQTKEYDEAQKRAFSRGMAMIGHNRKATKGTVVDRNAHPFNVDDNIILVHNGTMSEDHKQHADVEVDSHAIAHLIHEKGSVSEALSSFWGAYALIWYNVEEASIYMVRNSQRPLWWMETPSMWVWASTPDMLEFVRHRHDLKLVTEPTELPEDTLQKYKLLPNREWEVTNSKVEIKRATYSNVQDLNQWGHSRRSRFHEHDPMYDWTEQEWGDQAFRGQRPRHQATPVAPVQLLPRPQQQHPNNVNRTDTEPLEFAGLVTRERALANESKNIITYGEYQQRIMAKGVYSWDHRVHVVPFDYTYVNGTDTSDGFYLYAVPVDGDSVMFRQYFSKNTVTEDRILQMASGGYIYEYVVGQKYWSPMSGADQHNYRDDTPGFLIVRSKGCTLISRPHETANAHILH